VWPRSAAEAPTPDARRRRSTETTPSCCCLAVPPVLWQPSSFLPSFVRGPPSVGRRHCRALSKPMTSSVDFGANGVGLRCSPRGRERTPSGDGRRPAAAAAAAGTALTRLALGRANTERAPRSRRSLPPPRRGCRLHARQPAQRPADSQGGAPGAHRGPIRAMADDNHAMAVEAVAGVPAEPAAELPMSDAPAGAAEVPSATGASREPSAAPSTAATPGPGDDDGMAGNEQPLPIVTDDVADPRTPAEREALVPVRPGFHSKNGRDAVANSCGPALRRGGWARHSSRCRRSRGPSRRATG